MSADKKTIIIILSCILIFAALFSAGALFVPEEISLLKGSEKEFNINIPAEATILSSDTKSPVSAETDKNLISRIRLSGDETGTANLQLSMFGIPIKAVKVSVLPNIKLVPSGEAIGIRINTDGIMVLGIGEVTGADKKSYMPCANILKSGDLILKANGKETSNKEKLIEEVGKSGGKVNLLVNRSGQILDLNVNAVMGNDNEYKIGIWVRDSTQGIGTVTFYDNATGKYGALGHGIADVDTSLLMSVKNGKIMNSQIKDIRKSENGTPGELMGIVDEKSEIGSVEKNTSCGIFGKLNDDFKKSSYGEMPIALKEEVKKGKAYILCDIDGNGAKPYEIEIESINTMGKNECKSMVIKITDKNLLSRTNGIVQGMSGSPIIQDNKLVGAVTHVFIKDSAKGYGIFIQNMLEAFR